MSDESDWPPEAIELRKRLAEHKEQARVIGNELGQVLQGRWPDFPRCPRCGRVVREMEFNSRSRITTERDVAICDLCGKLEATRDFADWPPIPPNQWPVDTAELGIEFSALCLRDRTGVLEFKPVEDLGQDDQGRDG